MGDIISLMAQDLIGLSSLVAELRQELKNARIVKIYQPSDDELVFNLRKNGDKTLLISTDPNLQRIHLTLTKQANPIGAPAFCMLLRKYLGGALIVDVSIHNCDRIVKITLKNLGDMKDENRYYLLFESFGRYGNVILTKDNMTIIDVLKRIPPSTSERTLLPNLQYPEQPHGKIRLDDEKNLNEVLSTEGLSAKFICEKLSGINKYSAAEIAAKNNPAKMLKKMLSVFNSSEYSPCLYFHGDSAEILPMQYNTLGAPQISFETMSEAYDYYYAKRAASEKKRRETKELSTILKRLKGKYLAKIDECNKIVKNDGIIEKYLQFGELILSNLYHINTGDSILKCVNFYNNLEVEIPLDPLVSAKRNAEAYFKKYKKSKHAKEVAESMLSETTSALEYLYEIEASLSSCDTLQEYSEILEELYKLLGRNKRQNVHNTKKKNVPSTPLKFECEGYTILVGKNNLQNDKITFNYAKAHDLWFHIKNYHGSHVVVLTEGRHITDNVILFAASLAAKYSQAHGTQKVEVDYTERRNVKRKGNFPGLVNYTDFSTVTTIADN